jgi:hypothetical protein
MKLMFTIKVSIDGHTGDLAIEGEKLEQVRLVLSKLTQHGSSRRHHSSGRVRPTALRFAPSTAWKCASVKSRATSGGATA